MIWLSRGIARLAILVILSVGVASAQDFESHRWTANVGIGFTPLVGALDTRLDNGWHVTFGVGYKIKSRFSIGGQVMYNGFGVSQGLIREVGTPGANSHLWAFTAEPRYSFAPKHHFNPYVVGGVGYYRRVVNFTAPTVATVTIFDPFFGFFPILVPANVVLGSIVRDGIGGNAGVGFSIPVGSSGAKLFTEARYHYSNGGGIPTRMIPLTVGIRF